MYFACYCWATLALEILVVNVRPGAVVAQSRQLWFTHIWPQVGLKPEEVRRKMVIGDFDQNNYGYGNMENMMS